MGEPFIKLFTRQEFIDAGGELSPLDNLPYYVASPQANGCVQGFLNYDDARRRVDTALKRQRQRQRRRALKAGEVVE